MSHSGMFAVDQQLWFVSSNLIPIVTRWYSISKTFKQITFSNLIDIVYYHTCVIEIYCARVGVFLMKDVIAQQSETTNVEFVYRYQDQTHNKIFASGEYCKEVR